MKTEHETDGFSAALLLAQEFGEMVDQDNEERTSTFYFYQSKESYVFNHMTRKITIIKDGGSALEQITP